MQDAHEQPPAASGYLEVPMADVRSESAPAIEAWGLVKSFGTTRAVQKVDLYVPPGIVYGFLGPNGAGKTTVIRMLSTLMHPDAGTARIFGHDMVAEANTVRSLVGLTGQFASVDDDLTGLENLVLIARLQGFSWRGARQRAIELLEAFDLSDAARRQVKTYSGGMRRRLDIAASLVVTPDLLFLDEPTTGLDPRNRNQIWDIIRSLVADGITVFLTTQYLDEADELADRVAVIDHGTIIAEGTTGELKARVGSGALHIRLHDPADRPAALHLLSQELGMQANAESDNAELSARTPVPDAAARALLQLSRSGIGIAAYSFGQPSLDEVFLTLTGHAAEPAVEEDVTR